MEIDNVNMDTQMKLQDRLFYETKKNEALIANISGGVITFAVYQGKIKCEAVSEGACKLLGYTQEAMLL